jgi:2,4-dienoyl-CoA reductase-like NADH-dependent reductase (Old Yellow Enzyme family)
VSAPFRPLRIASLKTPEAFRQHCASLGLHLPCDESILTGTDSPFSRPLENTLINGKRPGNRIVIHPMEGWDGTKTGGVTDEMRRRWRRFGESGAKFICGSEAMAVRADGRANPNQLIIVEENKTGLAELVAILRSAHIEHYGAADDLIIGFQLTHSGRFCRPQSKEWESRIAFRHPILDRKFNVTSDAQVFTDAEIVELIACYVRAARIAHEVGADFVDLKHCHGYLLHEFLGAHTRPGKYGGSFENRTRILREIIAGIRADGNPIDLGVRLSCFDMVPHRPDPALSQPGKLGPGIPEDFSAALPYRYGFGVNQENPTAIDLTETFQFVDLLAELGVKILNTTAGSPYYTPHLQRPASFPPSDGYQPAYDPLIDVARQIQVVRQIRERAPRELIVIGSGYSYLQDYLPHVAQAVLRDGWADAIGVGRMVLSYPSMLADAARGAAIETKLICRTFSECTTAPRNGLISGCYPLDKFYTQRPEFQKLKEIKKATGA